MMLWPRKPIDLIAETLLTAVPDCFEVAEDVIADLEDAGWRFVFAPDDRGEERLVAWRDGTYGFCGLVPTNR